MSDPAEAQSAGNPEPERFSPGRVLGNARHARGLSIEDVAHALKLAPRQVEAIEVDAFEQLRGLTFARGFVRNYARYLGIDPAPLLDAIVPTGGLRPAELVQISNARGDLPVSGGTLRTLLPAGMTLVALIALALAGWYFDWFRVPAPTVTAEQGVSVPPAQKIEMALPSQLREERTVSIPPPPVEPPKAPTASAEALPPPVVPATGAVAPAAVPAEPAAVAEPSAAGQRLAFAFDQESWVEIRDGKGKLVHSQLHKAGTTEDVAVGGQPPYSLVIGNAAKVKLRFNDQPVDLLPFIKVSVARLSLQ